MGVEDEGICGGRFYRYFSPPRMDLIGSLIPGLMLGLTPKNSRRLQAALKAKRSGYIFDVIWI